MPLKWRPTMGIINDLKNVIYELEAAEKEKNNYQQLKADKINSLNNEVLVLNENNKMTGEELEDFLCHNDIAIPEGAFINKEGKIEYELLERCIYPHRIICPDCGGITLEGLDFCDKCGGEINIL